MSILVIIKSQIYIYMCDYLHHLKTHLETYFGVTMNIYQYKNSNIPLDVITGIKHVIFIQQIEPIMYKKIQSYVKNAKIYLLNTEQTTHNKFNVFEHLNKCPVEIIDYSLENLVNIKTKFPDIQTWHFPFPIFIQKHKIRKIQKEYNVVSLNNSNYRNNILCNINFKDFNNTWGSERDEIIEKSRVMLNIHYDSNYNIFESIRCYHAFENGCLIVSQDSQNQDLVLLKDCFYFEKLSDIVSRLNSVLKDYDNIFNDIYSDENIDNINNFFIDYYKNILLKMGIITNY